MLGHSESQCRTDMAVTDRSSYNTRWCGHHVAKFLTSVQGMPLNHVWSNESGSGPEQTCIDIHQTKLIKYAPANSLSQQKQAQIEWTGYLAAPSHATDSVAAALMRAWSCLREVPSVLTPTYAPKRNISGAQEPTPGWLLCLLRMINRSNSDHATFKDSPRGMFQ